MEGKRMIFDDISKLRGTILLRIGELQLTYEKLAERADVSPKCIRNYTSGEVERPRLDIFLKIMNALEFDIWLEARLN